MKLKLFLMLAVVSSGLIAGEARMPEEMLRGKNQQYQEGYRDGFREGIRMMNGGGSSGGGHGIINRHIQISKATYGTARGHCDFTNRLARAADDKTTYLFKSGNQWCGDPSGGNKKMATIEYTCHGKTKRALVKEGQSEFLRCH